MRVPSARARFSKRGSNFQLLAAIIVKSGSRPRRPIPADMANPDPMEL
jgi:hypothetical protein